MKQGAGRTEPVCDIKHAFFAHGMIVHRCCMCLSRLLGSFAYLSVGIEVEICRTRACITIIRIGIVHIALFLLVAFLKSFWQKAAQPSRAREMKCRLGLLLGREGEHRPLGAGGRGVVSCVAPWRMHWRMQYTVKCPGGCCL